MMILNKECLLLQNEIRKFAQQTVLEKADELNKAGVMPLDNLAKLADMGILGANAPEEFDGAGLDNIGTVVALEEISKVCASTALIVAVHNACFILSIARFGNDEQKKKYLSAAATGKIIGGYAMISANELAIQPTGNEYFISGKNHFLLNGEANGPFILWVKDGDSSKIFIVDADVQGIKRSKTKIIGMNSAGISSVLFENLRLASSALLGGADQSEKLIAEMNARFKLYLASIALGIMQGARDAALKYARERVQFNEPIINFGMIREKFADIRIRNQATQDLVYDAAMIADTNGHYYPLALIAKHFAGQSVVEICTHAIQIFGGYGYMKDYPVERYFRDAQVINVLGDRPDREKELIVKDLLGA